MVETDGRPCEPTEAPTEAPTQRTRRKHARSHGDRHGDARRDGDPARDAGRGDPRPDRDRDEHRRPDGDRHAATEAPRKKRTKKDANRSKPKNGQARECKTGKASTSTSASGCVEAKEQTEGDHSTPTLATPVLTNTNGSPATSNPSYSLATPGPAKIGVPNFFIDKFRIPPFLLPIYQAAGMEYGIRWEILAGINEIETDYGRNLNVSSAGALGWMQFMPATWKAYGVDANHDGVKDPFNPVDAIFAAARYLKAAGADQDIRKGIFAYNHADWYVDSVLMRAQVIGGIPGDLVGSLTGLTQGRFPVRAKATYAGALKKADQQDQGRQRRRHRRVRRDAPQHRDLRQGRLARDRRQRRQGAQARRQQAARQVRRRPGRLRQHLHLRAPEDRRRDLPVAQEAHGQEGRDRARVQAPTPTTPSTSPRPTPRPATPSGHRGRGRARPPRSACSPTRRARTPAPTAARCRSTSNGGEIASDRAPLGLNPKDFVAKPLVKGARILGGTTLGRIGQVNAKAPHLLFEIRPAGRGAPRIDPKPILDGWKLLESTEVYRAKGKNALFGNDAGRDVDRRDHAHEQGERSPAASSPTTGSASTAAARATSAPA